MNVSAELSSTSAGLTTAPAELSSTRAGLMTVKTTEKVVDFKNLSFHFTKHLEYTETPAGSKRSARPRRTVVRGDD